MGVTNERPSGGPTTTRSGNYRKGPWDGVSDRALDTEASHSIADSNLGLFKTADEQMDYWQERVDENLSLIRAYPTSPRVPEWTAAAQYARTWVEHWEKVNEDNVADAHGAVSRARVSNHDVLAIAETERRAAALAQRNGARLPDFMGNCASCAQVGPSPAPCCHCDELVCQSCAPDHKADADAS